MIRNALYLMVAASFLCACSGKVDLGNGPEGGAGDDGSGGSVKTGGSGSTLDDGGSGSTMITPDDSGTTSVGSADGGSSVEPTDASVGTSEASCFPDCMLDAGAPDGGFTLCGETECGPGESCVVTTTSGGPCLMPEDGGSCPKGTTLEGGCCVATPTPSYVCQITPASCGGELTCGCSASLCHKSDGCFCAGVSDNVLTCNCEAP
jgi:hypothetical protein